MILIIIAKFRFGGVSTQAFNFAAYLKRKGLHPVILAREVQDVRYCELLTRYGIDHHVITSNKRSGIMREFLFLISLVKELRRYRPWAIFPFNKNLGYSINLIWRFTGARRSFHMERNNGDETKTTPIGRLLRRIALLNATALLYNSEAASKASKYPRKTEVIRNTFINTLDRYESSTPSFTPDGGWGYPILLHVANISDQKNYDLLLRSWKQVKVKFPSAQLIILGNAADNQKPNTLNGMNQTGIFYLGSRPDIYSFILKADICLLSSFKEGCPNIILEYMFNKKMIVASDIPSIKEVLSIGNHDFLFENDSESDFVSKLETAFELSEEAKYEIITANSKKLESNYAENNFQKLMDLI